MTTLKDHQAAMVALLASGTAIPTSAARLAHALHDVLALITTQPVVAIAHTERRSDATTPGLNDKLLALDVEAVAPKRRPSEQQRIKQLENTIKQLKNRVAEVVAERDVLRLSLGNPEQAGCCKEDTQDDGWVTWRGGRQPVEDDVIVETQWSDGDVLECEAGTLCWHLGSGENIIAYRIVNND